MPSIKTQVAIIGAGPAGLLLANLLHQRGISCVVLESRNRTYIENRVRAGVLEQGTVDLLHSLNCGDRMAKEGLLHSGVELGFNRQRHHIDFPELTGKSVMVYGQHEVVKDLVAATFHREIPLYFEASSVQILNPKTDHPSVTFTWEDQSFTLECDFIAGCDGFHGISRPSIPEGVLSTFERIYPYSWLGILAEAAPSQEELVYMNSPRGFALFSMRSPKVTRLYFQCSNDERIEDWSDDHIWQELLLRLDSADGWKPNVGPLLQKSITPMRSFVVEPMQYGRLFLAGDAAHIVPPTGAKGLNLAAADVMVLVEGFDSFYKKNSLALLDRYSEIALRRVWKAQRFSWWMTSMFHRDPDGSGFDYRRQLAELDYITSSKAAATALAENYVGLPIDLG